MNSTTEQKTDKEALRVPFEAMAKAKLGWDDGMFARFDSRSSIAGQYADDAVQAAFDTYVAMKEEPPVIAMPEGWSVDISSHGMHIQTPFGPGYMPRRSNDTCDLFIAFCESIEKQSKQQTG